MKNPEVFRISPKKETVINNSIRISVVIPKEQKITTPSETAYHEAEHIVGAHENGTETVMATIIPGEGYDGLTIFTQFDAIGAAAPHANGRRGTGHDMALVSAFADVGSALSTARRVISRAYEKVEAIASALEEKKTLGSSDIHKVFEKVENPEDEEKEITVFIKNENGQQRIKKIKAHMENGTIVLPGEWITFPNE